jgi:hypothetical protein
MCLFNSLSVCLLVYSIGYLFVHLSSQWCVCLSACLFYSLSICLFVYLTVYLFVASSIDYRLAYLIGCIVHSIVFPIVLSMNCPFVFFELVFLFVNLSICLFNISSNCVFNRLSFPIVRPLVYSVVCFLPACLFVTLSVCQIVCVSACLFVCLSVCLRVYSIASLPILVLDSRRNFDELVGRH